MLTIAICDDNKEQLRMIQNATEQYYKTHKDCSVQVTCYDNPLLFLEALDRTGEYDILLLDIFMPGINGIEVAKEIRKRRERTEVIFLTTSDDFAVAAFSVKATHYLIKPLIQKEFEEAMDRAMEKFIQGDVRKMSYKLTGGGVKTVEIDDILYIESYKHEQQVHLKGEESLSIREALNSLLKQLEELSPNQFISPYKGYIVNLKAVHAVESNSIKLYGNKSVPIARRSFRELTDKYYSYAFGGNAQ